MTNRHTPTNTPIEQGKDSRVGLTRRKRAVLLVACIALGSAIGWLGARISGSDAWYLAIPACMALVWLVIADPSQCSRCEVKPEVGRDNKES